MRTLSGENAMRRMEMRSNMSEELQETTAGHEIAPTPVQEKKPRKWKGLWSNRKRRKWLIIAIVIVVAAVFVLRSCGQASSAKAADAMSSYTTETASYQEITQSLSGSGTLQPANSYTVTTLKEGEVLAADFEEGDVVTKDTVLYQLDSSDVSSNLEQAERNYEKAAYAKSPMSGIVASLDVKAGDVVSAGTKIATVRDSSTMTLKVPFVSDDAAGFSVGQSAEVVLDGSFETLTGKVTMVSAADTVLTGNRIVRYVTITLSNPGALTDTQAASATISGKGSSESATLQYKNTVDVSASSGGTVETVNVREGASVSANQVLVTFTSNASNDSVQQAADSLQNTQDQLDDYTITSPIDGTIVDKQYKTGDTVESGKTLCTIYDLSYLEMTMNIDELDITKVEVGQSVEITADAVEGKTYTGVITKVSMAGSTTNGTTSYPATVRIDETDGLRPGMNVDAEIVIEHNDNALAIPAGAVNRGNTVLITQDSPSAANALADQNAPEGYVYVEVTTGVSSDDYIEITSGLQEGDTVAYIKTSGGTSADMMMGGGMAMSGGAPSGGAPSGGGPGGGGGGPQG